MHTHTCEFCNTPYTPRPQTKKPRACNKDSCQKQRQSTNEKEWRLKNQDLSSSWYHKVRRKQRKEKIDLIIKLILKCISVGKTYLEIPISINDFLPLFENYLHNLGIRCINKFCEINIINNFEQLEQYILSNNLQTSSSP